MPGLLRTFPGARQEAFCPSPASIGGTFTQTTTTRPVTAAGPAEDDQYARRRPNYA
jgi:hypothetical protein